MTHEIKETVIAALRERGTLQYAALAAGISVTDIQGEIRRSDIFKKRVEESSKEGKKNLADESIAFIKQVADGEVEVKMPRLTAALALANAYEAGFRGQGPTSRKPDKAMRAFRTGIPRPKYDEVTTPYIKLLKNAPETIEGEATEVE